eukprot:8820030-Ditylum_brightwellii.AAC.1
MDLLIKNQIKNTIELVWFSQIHTKEHGFGNRAMLDIFQHLYTMYGGVGLDELTKNQEKMFTSIAPHHPIALLFKQLEDGQKFAASASVPFTNDQLIMYAKQLILGTGQYSNAYCMWMATPVPKIYQMLKMLFMQEHQLLNQMKHITRAAGYHGAHFASKDRAMGTDDTDTVSQQLEEAAPQFTVANAQGQQTMAQLIANNAQLQQQ